MIFPNFILLYVDNPLKSSAFYEDLLGIKPVELHPTFAAFDFESGLTLGLWSKHTAEPSPLMAGSLGGEIAFAVQDRETVDRTYEVFTQQGARIAQKPTTMDFGYTFVALDPDGHRLRVFSTQTA